MLALGYFVQDLHGLQRFYHILVIGVLSFLFPHLVELLLVRTIMLARGYFVQDLHGLQRFYHRLVIGVLRFTITPISTLSGAFVSEIQ